MFGRCGSPDEPRSNAVGLVQSPSDPLVVILVNPAYIIKRRIWNSPIDVKHFVGKIKPFSQDVYCGLSD